MIRFQHDDIEHDSRSTVRLSPCSFLTNEPRPTALLFSHQRDPYADHRLR